MHLLWVAAAHAATTHAPGGAAQVTVVMEVTWCDRLTLSVEPEPRRRATRVEVAQGDRQAVVMTEEGPLGPRWARDGRSTELPRREGAGAPLLTVAPI